MATRYDVSMVKPQGGYVAKRCPVRIQNDVLVPADPAPPTEAAALRMRQGVEFEETVVVALADALAEGVSAVFLGPSVQPGEAIEATVEAMDAGVDVIAGGWLPIDESGRRTGKPDLLLRHGAGYLPVDVKHHLTLEPADDDDAAAVSRLGAPFFDDRYREAGQIRRKNKADVLQLAHYRRMLEAADFSAGVNWAGIIGKELQIVWYDLDEPLWSTPAKSDGRKRKTRTSMEIYDFEFSFRLDIDAVAHRSMTNPGVELLVEPVSCWECTDCPWRDYCVETLAAGSGDPSLLPGVGYRPWRVLRDHGITDRRGVAELDYETARIGADGVDTPRLLERMAAADPATALADLLSDVEKQLSLLTARGFETVEDVVDRLDPVTAALGPTSFLPGAIINARAAVGPAKVYRLPCAREGGAVPRADIEIDVDMENTNDGVYLWGAFVTDRARTGLVVPGYRPFVSWEPLNEATECALFLEFWNWLTAIGAAAEARGASMRAYCWYEMAEKTQMLRIVARDPDRQRAVATFVDSAQWVDLYAVFKDAWTTGESTGLKAIAPLAGHEWSVDDPGGALSMVRYEAAIDANAAPAQREATRRWLLDYNRGDVEATRRIRDWLDTEGAGFPVVPT